MPNEMIERVARGLVKRRILHNAKMERRTLSDDFIERAVDAGHLNYIEPAKAAIAAMREPTAEMKEAAREYHRRCEDDGSHSAFTYTYRVMIDAALKE